MRDTFYTSVDFRSPASLSKVATIKSGFKIFFSPGVFQLREPEKNELDARRTPWTAAMCACVRACVCVCRTERRKRGAC